MLAGPEERPAEIGDLEPGSETLSVAEAARELGVSRPRIYALLRADQLESGLVGASTALPPPACCCVGTETRRPARHSRPRP